MRVKASRHQELREAYSSSYLLSSSQHADKEVNRLIAPINRYSAQWLYDAIHLQIIGYSENYHERSRLLQQLNDASMAALVRLMRKLNYHKALRHRCSLHSTETDLSVI